MTRSDVELPHEQEDNESEEVTYTTPEELIQVHRLWKMFMDRLEGRSLQFHDVVLREKRREMLEEVCFTSMEVAIVENEWAVIADVLKGCEAAAPANQQPGKDGFSFIPPNSETVAVWEASLTSTVHAIEAFSQTANAALTAIDDCKYRISLYADFLGDQIHRYLHYNNQRRAVHHLPDPGSPAETPMRRAAGKQAPQGLNASVGPIVSVPAFGIREMGIDDPSAKTVRKIDDKAVELLQECDEMKDAVVRWCHWLSTELLPWLLTAMRCVHVARTSAMLVRTRPRFAITYDVLQPLERVYDLRSELPRIYVPVVRPPRSIAEFISPRCSFAGAEANPCDNSPNDEGSPRVRNQPAPRDPAPAPPPAGDSLVSVSEQCAPRPVAAVSLFQKALPKCRRAAAGTPRPFPFPSADDPGDPQEAAGRQQMLKMLSRASLYSDPMIHSFSSSPASAPLRVSGGRPQPSRKHPSPLGDGAENDYGPLLRDDSSATSDGETTPPRLSRRLPFLGDVPKKPPPGHPAPAAPGGPHAAVAGGRRATKGEMAAGAVCLVGKILGFFAAECSATGALPLGTLTVKANDCAVGSRG
ncbi:hypothetical protein DIPPA_00981 [Diplonema papillatum]|nr:hypothetical protein DIPPA_00981 [Diplonema papillatum]